MHLNEKSFEENLKAFDTSLDILIDNFYETGFKSNAHLFYDQLPSIQNRLNDVESVFIISHHIEELNISYDTEIVVEKGSDGISTISIH